MIFTLSEIKRLRAGVGNGSTSTFEFDKVSPAIVDQLVEENEELRLRARAAEDVAFALTDCVEPSNRIDAGCPHVSRSLCIDERENRIKEKIASRLAELRNNDSGEGR